MVLKIENIGIVKKAEIKLKGITLIAGQNDSGKSTVGKALYALIRGVNVYQNDEVFYNRIGEYLQNFSNNTSLLINRLPSNLDEKNFVEYYFTNIHVLQEVIRSFTHLFGNFETLEERKKHIDNVINFLSEIKSKLKYIENEYVSKLEKSISNTINLLKEDKKSFQIVNYEILKNLEHEFGTNILNCFSDHSGFIEIDKKKMNISKNEGSYIIENSEINDAIFKDVVFIESPLTILNKKHSFTDESNTRDKNELLDLKLKEEKQQDFFNNNDENFKKYQNIIKKIIEGEFEVQNNFEINYKKNNQKFGMNSTATGIKSFGILQLLLKNNVLKPTTLLIIDEPEVHLHPQWQVKYAELLLLLSKELNITILLTSHSPYFIEALEAFTKKYNFESQTNFYFANKEENSVEIIDVTSDINPILSSISEAFYTIQDINDEN
jgi:predicted ATPase